MIKELRQAFRNRLTAAVLFVAPVIQLIVFGFAVDFDVENIPTVVCDLDRSHNSRKLAQELFSDSLFTHVANTKDPKQVIKMLVEGRAALGIVFPPALAHDLAHGRQAHIQVLVDGTEPNRAQIGASAASQFFMKNAIEVAMQKLFLQEGRLKQKMNIPQIRLEPRVFFNPQMASSIYMVPGVAALVLLMVTTIVTAMGLARERETGTMEQLMVTPIKPVVLMTGKCLPFAVIGLVDVLAILVVGSLIFDVPIRGPLVVVFSATLLYLMTTLGVGIFLSSVSASQQQAVLGAIFFITPAILLSGFMSPIENMPAWIQTITLINPVRYFVEIMRACLLKGASFSDLYGQFIALFLFGFSILTLSALRFKKQLS
jgi:ABC-2 type transport system permease protein